MLQWKLKSFKSRLITILQIMTSKLKIKSSYNDKKQFLTTDGEIVLLHYKSHHKKQLDK